MELTSLFLLMYLFFFQKNKFDVHAVYHSTSFFILIFLICCFDYFH
ncbi:hypothetical protein RV02_GL003479 [Enterococcus gilvus]|nr:hypothetical protein RV02_GL003479 [Enterococcus gilvus]